MAEGFGDLDGEVAEGYGDQEGELVKDYGVKDVPSNTNLRVANKLKKKRKLTRTEGCKIQNPLIYKKD